MIDSQAQHDFALMYFARQATLTITGYADEVTTRGGRVFARFAGLEIELQDAFANPPAGDVLTIEADLVSGRWRAARVLGLRAAGATAAHNNIAAQCNTSAETGTGGARAAVAPGSLSSPARAVVAAPLAAAAGASPFASLASAARAASRAPVSVGVARAGALSTVVGAARAPGSSARAGLNAGARVQTGASSNSGTPQAHPPHLPRTTARLGAPAAVPSARPGFDPDLIDDLDDDLPF
jgi:hypothetical protein